MLTSRTDYNMMSRIAAKQVEDYFNEYNKIGEKIARAYMVGITVGNTYGEAKKLEQLIVKLHFNCRICCNGKCLIKY